MFERIVVGLDGSEHADRALTTSIEVAKRFGAQMTLLTVQPMGFMVANPYTATATFSEKEEKELRFKLEEAKGKARAAGIKSVEAIFLQGIVVESILRYLADHRHDLLVVGSRGLSVGRRFLLGSVSSALVQEAPCPVLVVRPTGEKNQVAPS